MLRQFNIFEIAYRLFDTSMLMAVEFKVFHLLLISCSPRFLFNFIFKWNLDVKDLLT
jgi:hypothetical protein